MLNIYSGRIVELYKELTSIEDKCGQLCKDKRIDLDTFLAGINLVGSDYNVNYMIYNDRLFDISHCFCQNEEYFTAIDQIDDNTFEVSCQFSSKNYNSINEVIAEALDDNDL